MCLDCERKPENPEKSHVDTVKTCKICKQHHYATWQIQTLLLHSAHKVPKNYFCTFSWRDSQLKFSWRSSNSIPLSVQTHESAILSFSSLCFFWFCFSNVLPFAQDGSQYVDSQWTSVGVKKADQ